MNLPRFGVTRPVPVRLISLAVLIAGVVCGLTMRREFFPETDPDGARISLPYPGATPKEIEESMARKVEDALADLDEIEKIKTTLSENVGTVMVEFHDGVDVNDAVDEVQDAIDLLQDLPEDAEEIHVAEFEPRIPTITLTLAGEADELVMKQAIQGIRDDLRSLPGMGDIAMTGVRDYEIRVDVDARATMELGLSLPRISQAISSWMNELPGGVMRSQAGNMNVRTMGVPERAQAIREIVLKADESGRVLRVRDVARVSESFSDDQIERRFNGVPAVSLIIFKTGEQDAIDISAMVKAYAAGRSRQPFEPWLLDRVYAGLGAGGGADQPEAQLRTSRKIAYDLGASRPAIPWGAVTAHNDLARFIEGRLSLLTNNAVQGAILIFATLLIAMNLRMAFWVVIGLVTAICGTLLLMTWAGITLNLLTMFGLIIVLGMLEDDAIVVSENIMTRFDRGEPPQLAAINGAQQVFWPVMGTVLTTCVAFAPLMLVKGSIGDLLGALPMVVLCALLVSVLETMTILPSHMRHALETRQKAGSSRIGALMLRFEKWRDDVVFRAVRGAYARAVAWCIEYRYVSAAAALSILIISMGMVAGGRVEFTFLQESDSETVIADVRLPIGAALEETRRIAGRIEAAARAQPEVRFISTTVGERSNIDSGLMDAAATHLAQIFIELEPVENRQRESSQVISAIRKATGPLDEAEEIRYSEISGGPGGADISIELTSEDDEALKAVSHKIKAALAGFGGVTDISDDNFDDQRELRIQTLPAAAALGLTPIEIARQVRGAFHGIDAHVFSDLREDIDVRVRLDEDFRRSLDAVDRLWVITPQGRPVPLTEVARLSEESGYAVIRRINRERTVTITADTEHGVNPESITLELGPQLAKIRHDHPEVGVRYGGRQEDMADAFSSLPIAFLAALLMIYVILACLFSSYVQPLAVMLAIPFASIGVVWGHLVMGYQMTFLSLIGFVALAGVVVNNSLILIEFYNERRAAGLDFREAFVQAGRERLRPILLTTITTIFGLLPLVLETSFQAKFLIPMAISICFGLMSSTILTLLVLPCIMRIVEDVKNAGYYLWHGRAKPQAETEAV